LITTSKTDEVSAPVCVREDASGGNVDAKHLGRAERLSGSLNISRPAGDVRADLVFHRQGRAP
jgi:hypothetical protein